MKIHIETECKELESYTDLMKELSLGDTHELAHEISKNVFVKSPMFSMRNTRNPDGSITTTYELNPDLLVKIMRKLIPIFSAFKTILSMFVNLFKDIEDDMGDPDDWEIEVEGENDKEKMTDKEGAETV